MGTSNRRPYETATLLDQNLLNECQDNLANKLEMICEISNIGTLDETLYFSDYAKYVDGEFYEPRVVFPVINRTMGDWLAGQLEFSDLQIQVANPDGKYSRLLPGGGYYNGFIGRRVVVKQGLRELGSTYATIFSGEITDVAGFSRDTTSFTLVCRSDFEKTNNTMPNQTLIVDDFADIEEQYVGLSVPVIYGDWTTDLRVEGPEVPAYPINGNDPLVNGSFDPPNPNVGDTALRCVIASTPIKTLDTASITLLRGDVFYTFASSDITIIPATNNTAIAITQKNLMVDPDDPTPWIYEPGDLIFVKCVGVDLLTYDTNIVAQARDILTRFGLLSSFDFDVSWDHYQTKVTPAESAIASIKARAWIQNEVQALEYVLSMLEQVRLECFVNRENLFELSSLHFDEFVASPSFTLKNWDVVRGSFRPATDDRNQFNRAKADYRFTPVDGENRLATPIFKNVNAITQSGRAISKLVVFPNLVIEADVINQLKEILKLASAYYEKIDLVATPRSFLKDLAETVILNVNIGSVDFVNVAEPVTARIRKIGYDPQGRTIPMEVWSDQMVPFPGSLKAGVSGVTGGSTATITQE